MELNEEQKTAATAILEHIKSSDGSPFMVLKGPAGTGKSTVLTEVYKQAKTSILYTAPTNKAAKVLRSMLREKIGRYGPDSRTIFSALGLVMQPNGEIKELGKSDRELGLDSYKCVVVDEWSMLGTEICNEIRAAADANPTIRWVFSGDHYQLPPVNEESSPIASVKKQVELSRIMRTDNQILQMSAHLRGLVMDPTLQFKPYSDNDGVEGVWALPGGGLHAAILENLDGFKIGENKAIAWRNAMVDQLNSSIRSHLWEDAGTEFYRIGDRVTLEEPVKDVYDQVVATKHDEGVITEMEVCAHPLYPEFECWRLVMNVDAIDDAITLWVLRPSEKQAFESRIARMAASARIKSKEWKAFWKFKESFHAVRHAYAQTAHTSQGSTYTKAFVSWRDILRNPNEEESYRALYTAATRPSKALYLG